MKDAVKPFIQTCADASRVLIDVFNQKLGLPEGTLAVLHRTEMECISESRCIKVPPPPKDTKILDASGNLRVLPPSTPVNATGVFKSQILWRHLYF